MAINNFAELNGRNIGGPDVIYGVNARAKEAIAKYGKENVVNGAIGALLDDEGKLIVLTSVKETYKNLKPEEYAEYAPIGGTAGFKSAVIEDAFRAFKPKRAIKAVATPGGTGALRTTIANYSKPGYSILAANWYWANYRNICLEQARKLETYNFVTEDGKFDIEDYAKRTNELLEKQDIVITIINSPAHNPTGYSLTDEDWNKVKAVMENVPEEKKVVLLLDTAYIDFAGDEDEYRSFLKIVDEMPENVFVILSHSLSKGFTLYGTRCGAMICMAPTEELAEEFRVYAEASARATWSSGTRAPQEVIAKVYADPELKAKVKEERTAAREMLLKRGKAFEEEANKVGLKIFPFDAGFFCSVPSPDPKAVCEELEKENIFLVPLALGVRLAISAVSEENCRMLPAKIKAAMEKLGQ